MFRCAYKSRCRVAAQGRRSPSPLSGVKVGAGTMRFVAAVPLRFEFREPGLDGFPDDIACTTGTGGMNQLVFNIGETDHSRSGRRSKKQCDEQGD